MRTKKSTPTLAETNRRTEKWFRRGLWLLAVVFASFLIGLGGKIVDDLPKVEQSHELSHYIADKAQYEQLNAQKSQLEKRLGEHENALEQAQLALEKQRNETQSQREKYIASLATRKISEDREQNEKVFERTAEYEQLLAKERDLEKQVEQVRQQKLDTEQAIEQISGSLNDLETAAQPLKAAADRATELKVFLYRLALTLPLLLAAGWLFKNKRQSRWFPFVWGFIFFALFAFFCGTGAVFAQLWRLCAPFGRHCRNRVGGQIRHCRHVPLFGAQTSRRSPADYRTRNLKLRFGTKPFGETHLPQLRTPFGFYQ